jgi:pimeloyl-ACP methyl ester carboxylesterase
MQPPVIIVPGITASTLRDEYAVTPDVVWNVLQKRYDRVMLHPDDLRFEGLEPARVRADHLFDLPYTDFIGELRHNLADREDRPVPVYPFAYDWRMPLDLVQLQLANFIEEVVARTCLLRHYHSDGYADNPQVDLVGHSMGGLIITGYLATSRDNRVRKVATLGTPFRGSFEAVLKVATGTAALGPARQNSREREAARLTPSLYHLVPSFEDGVTAPHEEWTNLFNATSWQPGVIATIAEQIRLSGVEPPKNRTEREAIATALLQKMLDEAANHRATTEAFDLADAGMNSNDWLCVVGVGERTRTALKVEDNDGAPFFRLDREERKNGYPKGPRDDVASNEENELPWETGDGTVPYAGARASFIGADNIVCVCDADFGYWEIRDRLLEGPLVTLHGLLPAMSLVQKLVAAHLKGQAGRKAGATPGIRGRRAPDLARTAKWDPPIAGLEEKGG